ncbi:MAG: N-acetylmuramoyl-L-alanine amidase [bacterium]
MRTRFWKRGWTVAFFAALLLIHTTGYSRTSDCVVEYNRAAEDYYHYKQESSLKPDQCQTLMDSFQSVAGSHPNCHKADDALYMVGFLAIRAYRAGGDPEYLDRALDSFQTLIHDYRDSSLADDAQYLCGEVELIRGDFESAEQAYQKTLEFRSGDMGKKAMNRLQEIEVKKSSEDLVKAPAEKPEEKETAEPEGTQESPASGDEKEELPSLPQEYLSGNTSEKPDAATEKVSEDLQEETSSGNGHPDNLARLLEIRHWSNQDYTRVVVDLDREVPYKPPHLLKPDPELGTPPRLYIDFEGVAISKSFRQRESTQEGCYGYALSIGDGLLKKARAGQYKKDVVRVVLDIERIDHYKAFALPGDPFRYVIDVYGDAAEKSPPGVASEREKKDPEKKRRSPDRKFVVVLDPGHGGKDPGAVGPSGTYEKDIVLALAKRTKKTLSARRPDVEVRLTRTDDRFLTLVERTAMANTMGADLFVSIHCNAARTSNAAGIESYYLDNTTDRASLKLAAKENFVTEKTMRKTKDTTNLILADMITSSKVEDSVPLARYVQKSMISHVSRKYPDTKDKGVKKAPFWVLTGATMPAVLLEVNFISNPKEEKRLRSSRYQQEVASSIALGITDYLDNYRFVTMNREK